MDLGVLILDLGVLILDLRVLILDLRVLILDLGVLILGVSSWRFDFGGTVCTHLMFQNMRLGEQLQTPGTQPFFDGMCCE